MLNFLFGSPKAKKAQAKPVKLNVYSDRTKPFPNAYYNTNRGTM